MIDRYPILACALTVILVGYLCFALPATASMAREDRFTGCRIEVADSLGSGFVSQLEISQECDNIMQWVTARKRKEVDLNLLESHLRGSDKIEDVNVSLLNNGTILIDVVPMTPVARIFDTSTSYYINATGKRISADPRYHVDVPVVVGNFTDDRPSTRLLPLLHHIASHPELDALVSTVKQARNGDIIIVPTIRGHVVNFGDTSDVDNKFTRLREFYRQVMPVRGWETYDTIAVKWRGQVVATRRDKALATTSLAAVVEEFDDIDDTDTMISPLHTENSESSGSSSGSGKSPKKI
ncbi:MAG: hypothetical protein JFR41_07555 [Muribaculaceae bacterium]|nr:hypothetical protein [Muribaculaceae bacterium]